MGYLERLKKSANAGAGTLKNQNNPETDGLLGSLGTPPGPFQKIEGATAAADAEPARQCESDTEERGTPTPPPRNAPVASCRTCRHLGRPGLSAGYCGGRDDLPPAYTAGHPLRRLPDDGGASCTTWELAT